MEHRGEKTMWVLMQKGLVFVIYIKSNHGCKLLIPFIPSSQCIYPEVVMQIHAHVSPILHLSVLGVLVFNCVTVNQKHKHNDLTWNGHQSISFTCLHAVGTFFWCILIC